MCLGCLGFRGLGIRVLGLFKVYGSSIECAHTLLEAPRAFAHKVHAYIYVCFFATNNDI